MKDYIVKNPWDFLRDFTDARIGLGRTGISLPTNKLLDFQLSHAQARDAVHLPLDIDKLLANFSKMYIEMQLLSKDSPKGLLSNGCFPIVLHSKAMDR
ncbi:MAG: ethanolamine ammonia-lyase small subunit, partial [Sulfurimonas sp.]